MAFTKITASGIGSTETVTLDGLSVINDGSFGGNVSVGGTLTYEDVTNIDSVGLITARAGVVVGSGITLSKDGDIFATGITTVSGNVKVGTGITLSPDGDVFATGVTTATTFSGAFSGSGANITALNASNLASGTVPTARLGSGTASSSTFLAGDSTFKTVTGTTINNNADNRLITGSGTANTLEGESTLTYDSGGLNIAGDSSRDGLKITNTGDHLGEICVTANRSAANNAIMVLRGEWNNTEVASIYISAGSDTTNKDDGQINFYTSPDSGTGIQNRMGIDQNGYITMPNRPMFSGRPNISNAFRSATETMQLTSHVNVGGHWSNSNYNFTCPITGYYFMSCNTISNVETYMYFRKDTGSGFTKIYTSSHSYSRGDGGNYRGLSATHIESCNAGDKLDFYIQGGYYGLEHGSGVIYLLA